MGFYDKFVTCHDLRVFFRFFGVFCMTAPVVGVKFDRL